MRIGIDAKWYFSGPPSGVNVVRNIVNSLVEYDHENEILFILNSKDNDKKEYFEKLISKNQKLSYKFVPCKLNFITNLFILPFYLNNNFDVALFQNYVPFWGGHKTKYINYVHDVIFMDYPQFFTSIERLIYRFMLISIKKAHHVITISQSERKRIIKHTKISPDKISFVYHGLDPMFYERSKEIQSKVRIKYNLPAQFILYVGRINIRKNIQMLLKSFSELNNDIHLVLVGKDENNGFNFNLEVKKLNIENKVYKIGHVPDDDLAEIMSSATLFVYPSFAEGFGLPPLEAMKSGTPTIVSNISSLPEVCGDAALSFDVENYSDLTSKMSLLLSDPQKYQQVKMNGINKAKEYSWQNSIQAILGILNKQASI